MARTLEVDGVAYEVQEERIIEGQNFLGIFNTKRRQYEVYSDKQVKMYVPYGTDDQSLVVAFADAQNNLLGQDKELMAELAEWEALNELPLEEP